MTSCLLLSRRKHRGFFLAFLAASRLLCAGAADQATHEAATGPGAARIQFASTTNDFGRIVVGDVVKHEFFFTNTGNQPLLILEVKSICGCTTAAGLGSVEAGKEGRIAVEFHSSGMDGPFEKAVLVSCSDPEKPQIALQLKGTVWVPIQVTPPNAAFTGALNSSASLTRVLKIKNQEKEPLTLSAPRSSHKQFTAEVKTIKKDQEYELAVRLVPPLGGGNVFGDVQLDTSSRSLPLLKIPVWAISQGGVLVFPRKIELAQGPLNRKQVRKVEIRNNLGEALALGRPVVNTPGVEAQLVEEEKGQGFTVTLTFEEGYVLPVTGAELKIPADQPGSQAIRVPIVEPSDVDGSQP